jgi:hypothetical protein
LGRLRVWLVKGWDVLSGKYVDHAGCRLRKGRPHRDTLFNGAAFVGHYNAGLIGTESWLSPVQRARGYVVRLIWLLRGRRLAADDLEGVAVVDSILRQQPRDLFASRQLRKRARVTELWVRFRELGLGYGNHVYSTNRGIDKSKHHQSSHPSECEVSEDGNCYGCSDH